MIRAVLAGILAVATVVAVLAVVFAVGALRISVANRGDEALPTTQPAPAPLTKAVDPVVQIPEKPIEPPVIEKSIVLTAEQAKLTPTPTKLRVQEQKLKPPSYKHSPPTRATQEPVIIRYITGWTGPDDGAEWTVSVSAPGDYEINVVYSCPARTSAGGNYVLSVGPKDFNSDVRQTRGEDNYEMVTLGTASLPAGQTIVRVHPTQSVRKGLMNLRSVRLVPAS